VVASADLAAAVSAVAVPVEAGNTDYKSKCAFGSFQSQRRFDLVTAFTPVYTG
jgi:hypothetical protein